jgi:hypothetical protein
MDELHNQRKEQLEAFYDNPSPTLEETVAVLKSLTIIVMGFLEALEGLNDERPE